MSEDSPGGGTREWRGSGAASAAHGHPPLVGHADSRLDRLALLVSNRSVRSQQPEEPPEPWWLEDRACFLLPPEKWPRSAARRLVAWVWFDRSVLLVIVLNSLLLASLSDPILTRIAQANGDPHTVLEHDGEYMQAIDAGMDEFLDTCKTRLLCTPIGIIEFLFLLLFTLEMLVKMLAHGVVGRPDTYLHSPWNWLDGVVVVTGWLELSSDLGVSALRLLRVLRPLRVAQRISGMRELITALIAAMPACSYALLLLFMVNSLFAIIGLQAFHGSLRHLCHRPAPDGVSWVPTSSTCNPECLRDPRTQQVVGSCASLGNRTRGLGWRTNGYSCMAGERCLCAISGADDGTCTFEDNPNFGASSFDNFMWASMSFLQVMSLEGWSGIMYSLMDGIGVAVPVYFVAGILVSAFIVSSLFLAVLAESFSVARQSQDPGSQEDGAAGPQRIEMEPRQQGAPGAAQPPSEAGERRSGVMATMAALSSRAMSAKSSIKSALIDGQASDVQSGQPTGRPLLDDCILRSRSLTASPWFERAVLAAIFVNIVELSLRWAPADPSLEWRRYSYLEPARFWSLYSTNVLITLFFCFEMVVKNLALGVRAFVADRLNLFDFIVVLLGVVDIIVEIAQVNGSAFSLTWVAAFRTIRILRAFRLVHAWKRLSALIATLFASIRSIAYLALVVALFILVFALLGMELFGGLFPNLSRGYTAAAYPNVFHFHSIEWDPRSPSPRANFDSLGEASMSIFIVLSGENWNDVLYAIASARPVVASIYFGCLYLLGNLILFNLFVAIVLTNLEEGHDKAMHAEEPRPAVEGGEPPTPAPLEAALEVSVGDNGYNEQDLDSLPLPEDAPVRTRNLGLSIFVSMAISRTEELPHLSPDADRGRKGMLSRIIESPLSPSKWRNSPMAEMTEPSEPSIADLAAKSSARSPGAAAAQYDGGRCGPRAIHAGAGEASDPASSKFSAAIGSTPAALPSSCAELCELCRSASGIRDLCGLVIRQPLFDQVVMVAIVASSVQLAFDWPGYSRDSPERRALVVLDVIFAMCFWIEALLRVLGDGLLTARAHGRPAYLRSVWCLLDLVVLIIATISLLSDASGLGAWRTLRALRALRPLRVLPRHPGMRRVVSTLVQAMPAVGALGLISLLLMLVFGLTAMQLFAGRLGYCLDPLFSSGAYGSRVIPGLERLTSSDHPQSVANDYHECTTLPKYNLTRLNSEGVPLTSLPGYELYYQYPRWVQPNLGTFDNLATSMLLLFEFATAEGWPTTLFALADTDATEEFITPWPIASEDDTTLQEHHPNFFLAAVFCVAWIIVGHFVLLNMVISIVLNEFSRLADAADGAAFMSADQLDWLRTQQAVLDIAPPQPLNPPEEPWRRRLFDIVTTAAFEVAVAIVIAANAVTLALFIYKPEAPWIVPYNTALIVANDVFIVVYAVEMVAKILGLGVVQYLSLRSNQFDAALVLLGFIELILASINLESLPFASSSLRALRLVRVLRAMRVLQALRPLRSMTTTIALSLPAVANVSILMILGLFIYAVVGCQLFWAVAFTPSRDEQPFWTAVADTSPPPYFFSHESNAGDFLGRHVNFETFGSSLLTFTSSVTGEGYNGIMHELFSSGWGDNALRCCPSCGPVVDGTPASSCGSTFQAALVFLSFALMLSFVVISLFVGAFMETFAQVDSPDLSRVTLERLEEFRDAWVRLQACATRCQRSRERNHMTELPRNLVPYMLPSHMLSQLLHAVPQPLGVSDLRPALRKTQLITLLSQLAVPDRSGFIHFHEVLVSLTYRVAGVAVPMCPATSRVVKQARGMPALPARLEYGTDAVFVAQWLQSVWRGHLVRTRAKLQKTGDRPSRSYDTSNSLQLGSPRPAGASDRESRALTMTSPASGVHHGLSHERL